MTTLPRSHRWLALLAAVCVSLPAAPVAQSASRTPRIIRAARLLEPGSGTYLSPAAVHVEGDRIARVVGGNEALDAAADLDLGDLTLLPGLVDAHVHLQIGGEPGANALAVLRAGFTTVVDLGATSDAVLRLRDAVAAGKVEGPRILGAGLWMGIRNGVCDFNGIGIANAEDAFRARVRSNVDAGADLLKVCVSGWPERALARPREYEITDDALAAAVAEAHRAKRLVIGHAISAGAVDAALRADVDGLAHAAFVDEQQARRLRDQGVFLIPTLASLTRGPCASTTPSGAWRRAWRPTSLPSMAIPCGTWARCRASAS